MSVKWLKRLHEYHPDLAQVALQLNHEDGFVMADEKPKKGAAEAAGGAAAASPSSSPPAASDPTEQDRGRSKGKKEKRSSSGKSRSKSKSKRSSSSGTNAASAGGGNGDIRELNADGRKKHSTAEHDMALEDITSGPVNLTALEESLHNNSSSEGLLRSATGISPQKGYGSADALASTALASGSTGVSDDGASGSDGEKETKGGKRKIAAVAVGVSSSCSTVISMEEVSQLDLP